MPVQGKMQNKCDLVFFVNGKRVDVIKPDPAMTVLEYLRREHWPVNACLAPLCSLHGLSVTTVEGIGRVREKLHPVQRQLAENHGSQCGFCTPGIVMSMYTLLRNNPNPTRKEMEEAFDGNLCRCTGYRPILEGFKTFTKDSCALGTACCRNNNNFDEKVETHRALPEKNSDHANGFLKENLNGNECNGNTEDQCKTAGNCPNTAVYDPSQDIIFPPELKLISATLHKQNLEFHTCDSTWFRPTSLKELINIKKSYPDCKLVCGNTEIGVEMKLKKQVYPVMVSVCRIHELTQVQQTEGGIKIGGSLTLDKVIVALKSAIRELPEYQTRVFAAFIEMLRWFAGHQIRSVASMAGNIITASPISDFNPLLLACKAVLEVADSNGNARKVVMDDKFFTGYRRTCLDKGDILLNILLPYTKKNEFFFGYKQANRKEDDISIVSAGMQVDLGKDGTHVSDITLAFGGMAEKTVLAQKTMASLKGKQWDHSLLKLVCSEAMLPSDLSLAPGSPGGMVAYRRTLSHSFFFRFFLNVSEKIQQISVDLSQDMSGKDQLNHGVSSGSQVYHMPSNLQSPRDFVGRPVVHQSAYQQTTGEAIYLDDIPVSSGELFAGFVMSTKAHAKILKIDATHALGLSGVVDFVSCKDVPGNNLWVDDDDVVFADEEILHEGQVVGVVLAESLSLAHQAASQVEITYEDLEPIVTIQDAISANSYFHYPQLVECGDVDKGMLQADHVVEGEIHIEAQEHMYLEPQACIVYPRDTDEFHVVCVGQGINTVQTALSEVLGLPLNHINVSVKRIGGGFGGKVTRHCSVVLPSAVAAYKTHRPVRTVLERDEDMKLTGTRHPALAKYKIGFSKEGKLMALDTTVYFNCGHSRDYSDLISERALLVICGSYKIPNVRASSKLCKTNIASRTAFRGFGAPQGFTIIEHIIDHVSTFLGLPEAEVRQMNFYNEGDIVAFGQKLVQNTLSQCWSKCQLESDYYQRVQEVENFNKINRWKKRGIAMVPLSYGIGFTVLSKNKASAVVTIYKDGSVLLLISGTEMGQGLHTKMIQVASRALDIPISYIKIADQSSFTASNAASTAASFSSDLCGMAVLNACEQLKETIAPYKKANPGKEWKDVANEAIEARECLTSVGSFKPNMPGMDWTKRVNSPFLYFTYGAACTEVEIDCLTGDHQVLRTDIVMDVGHSLNPAIDVGQIEGGFVQGYGMLVLEQYKMSPKGTLITKGPGAYKIPSFANIPQQFNVMLLKNKGNPKAVYSSKGIGEPPLCLSTSVFFAIKAAIRAARAESGLKGHFRLDTPATPDKIRLSCMDSLAQQFIKDDEEDKKKPWFVQL